MTMFTKPNPFFVKMQNIQMRDFHERRELYVTRPPYQRKVVWSTPSQRTLLDSIFRGYYIPRLVLRQVLIHERTKFEVIDGQQRISVIQRYFDNHLTLPDSLRDVRPDLPGKTFSELPEDVQNFLRFEQFDVDMVVGLEDPFNDDFQRIATGIFRRLQEGESLTYMEKAHARLNSMARNFLVKYADDIAFDYESYRPIDDNPRKHQFFRNVYKANNDRMQHLAFLCRLLLFERANGPADTRESDITNLLEASEVPNGIGDESFENTPDARRVLKHLNFVCDIVKNDPQLESYGGLHQFETEYFSLSFYLLARYIQKHYVITELQKKLMYEFLLDFHEKWKWHRHDENNHEILSFAENRQQSKSNIEARQRILLQLFFEFATEKGVVFVALDGNRSFNEAERIRIYRRDRGLCQNCLKLGLSEEDSQVSWDDYEADHIIPHSKGGRTAIDNGQLLCKPCNQAKSNQVVLA